jgi:hypothetical protein
VLIIVVAMLIQGLGILLPTNLRVYYELRKSEPDMARIQRLMRRYVKVVATQAILQFVVVNDIYCIYLPIKASVSA